MSERRMHWPTTPARAARALACVVFCCLAWSSHVRPACGQGDPPGVEFFEQRIRPILVDHCYDCHGPSTAESKLRLDTKSGWQRGGERGPVIVPGDPAASLLLSAVSYRDPQLQMPPPDAGGKLTARQIDDLTTWIRQGAPDPRTGEPIVTEIDVQARTHWAFQPVQPPAVDPAAHPLDFLIERQLRQREFTPTEPADSRTLVRRATFDLHGLPPTAAQLATSREDFPQLVQELLASPRYGERWGRHWLDVARYSDAKDGVLMYGDARIRPFAYTYRDYVIRAFNDDKPFDQFILEQLAADQLSLDEAAPELAALGLLTLGRMFDRNPHDVIDDQIDVVTRAFLGLTVTCARCHDHKFDPVPTADYYSLYGVFASCLEPYDRPRIAEVSEAGQAFETEFAAKLQEVRSQQQAHYEATLRTARERIVDYLVQVATTEPDVAETTIFFLSLIPDQLRPQMTRRWRQLIARRAFPDDPIFGPWYDLLRDPQLRVDEWRRRGVDPRIIAALAEAQPQTPVEVARTYGEVLLGVWAQEKSLQDRIVALEGEMAALAGGPINLADLVAGGNGFGSGQRGHGIHPATGAATKGDTGFITIENFDQWIPAPEHPFVDGVFVPKSNSATISSTGLRIDDLPPTSGQTWDYFKYGPSNGAKANTIDGVDYAAEPNWMLGLHANKGITFDIQALREAYAFAGARFVAVFGHGGAQGESRLDFAVYVDGRRVLHQTDFPAQGPGLPVDLELPQSARFLTLVVTEGGQGISHDQAILGNPRIVPADTAAAGDERRQRIGALKTKQAELRTSLANLQLEQDPLGALMVSRESPFWFPIQDVANYLSRQPGDAYRGLLGQLDAIAVKHRAAAARAMVVMDAEELCDPVIFQRGDPSQRGAPVPRQFLQVLAPHRTPFSRGGGRLELAQAIAARDNPLTARVWVNRVWMHHFGEPLVENPGDFGLRTPRPVHHELLDYLADYFMRNGWRTKPLHELIMTSQAYQRASRLPASPHMARQLEADPANAFYWRANRRRLDLEQMRDTMLEISGRLDLEMFGRPPLITDADNCRRTVYAFVERQNIPTVVQTFDFANADTSTSRRVTTTVPQQALFALNSPFMLEAAGGLARRVESLETLERIQALYALVYGRAALPEEVELAREFVAAGSWEQFAQVLLMSNELMFID